LGSADPNHKCSQWYSTTQLNSHPRRQNPLVLNSPNASYVSQNFFSFFINFLSGRALDYRPIVDSFAHVHRDLWQCSLSNEEWEVIELVAKWLKSFRAATTQMSATRTPMLSTMHAVFRGLQDDIRNILRDLPDTASPSLKKGLTDAHLKLSDYYYKIDASPFYLWSSHKFDIQFTLITYL